MCPIIYNRPVIKLFIDSWVTSLELEDVVFTQLRLPEVRVLRSGRLLRLVTLLLSALRSTDESSGGGGGGGVSEWERSWEGPRPRRGEGAGDARGWGGWRGWCGRVLLVSLSDRSFRTDCGDAEPKHHTFPVCTNWYSYSEQVVQALFSKYVELSFTDHNQSIRYCLVPTKYIMIQTYTQTKFP